jgi:Glycosyl transferase family 11
MKYQSTYPVIARIEGGLGNQLFQYAAARSLADRLGCDLALDLRGLEVNSDRTFQLNLYRIRAFIASGQLLSNLPKSRPSKWRHLLSNLSLYAPRVLSFPVFWSRSFAYDERFAAIRSPKYLVGYWQSEKYFDWNRAQILKDVELIDSTEVDHILLQKIKDSKSVALHIRRGDYISDLAASQFHGLCDMAYYYAAVQALKIQEPSMHLFVFSDDPQWARVNFRTDVPATYIDANASDKGYLDLELMRHCKHHIIANSSFSWWGAWLRRAEEVGQEVQQVYAPMRWFAVSNVDTSDVIPASWNQLH